MQWATQRGIPFLAQSGGHAWSSRFLIGQDGIVISLRRLNSVVVDLEKGTAIIGAGANVGEVMRAAKEKGAHVGENLSLWNATTLSLLICWVHVHVANAAPISHIVAGTCNSVGAVASISGGGIGFMMV